MNIEISILQNFVNALPEKVALFDTNFKLLFKSEILIEKELNNFLEHFRNKYDLETFLNQLRSSKKYEISVLEIESVQFKIGFQFQTLIFSDQTVFNFFYIKFNDLIDSEIEMQSQIDQLQMNQINLDRMKGLAEIAAGISHEINNPLTVIVAKTQYIKILFENAADNKLKILDSLDKIYQYSDRITKIIRSLKNFSRDASADQPENNLLSGLIEDAMSLLGQDIRLSGIQIEVDMNRMNILVRGIPSEITQILVNLIRNAVDVLVGLEQPRIQILLENLQNKKIKLSVVDNGAGISKDDIDKIFKSFYTTKSRDKGTGLGLSLSKYLAEKNKGSLYLDTENIQTCFCLVLST